MPSVLSIFQEVRDNNLAAVTQIISTSPHLVHARDETFYNVTPLHWAAALNHGDLCFLLLQHGADVDADTPGPGTPLMVAVEENHGEACNILLSHGANVNYIRSSNGFTPLHSAVQYGYLDICQLLLSYKADINGVRGDGSGYTALHESAISGHSDITNLLISYGGNIHVGVP